MKSEVACVAASSLSSTVIPQYKRHSPGLHRLIPLFTTCISRIDFLTSFWRISFESNEEILTRLFNPELHQTNLNFKSRHLHKSTSWGRTRSSQSLLLLYHPVYFGSFIRCHPGKNKELYCFWLEETGGRKPERAVQWSKMGRNAVRRTCVSSAGRLLEPGLCSQSSHLLAPQGKRSRLASVDTVKSFVLFMATEGRICVFLRDPICYPSLSPCHNLTTPIPKKKIRKLCKT